MLESRNNDELSHRENILKTMIVIIIVIVATVYVSGVIRSHVSFAYIVSGSMEPTYYRGDLIILEKVRAAEIQVGDVIVFKSPMNPNILILHRVVAKRFQNGKFYFLTKGDNPDTNIRIDRWGWVPEDLLYGRMIARVPLIGYVAEILSHDVIRYSLLILLGVLIVLTTYTEKNERLRIKKQCSASISLFHRERIISISMLGLIFFTATMTYSILWQPKHDVKIKSFILLKQEDEDFNETVFYVTMIIAVKSYGAWISSIRTLKFYLYVNTTKISEATWTITYNFYGEKTIAAAFVISRALWENFSSLVEKNEVYVDIDMIVINFFQEIRYQKQIYL